MSRVSTWAALMLCASLAVFSSATAHAAAAAAAAAAPTTMPQSSEANRPASLAIRVGDITTRIDGPKLWTLSGIEYQGDVMAVQDSAYGTVVTIEGVGHLGTAHFLEVPGKPGEVEKELVTDVRFFVDGKPVETTTPNPSVTGKSFQMRRKSKIRDFSLESQVDIRDGVLIESSHIRTDKPVQLKMTYPLMYAWTPSATEYLFGSDDGSVKGGTFVPTGAKPTEGLEKSAQWMAVYDPASGKVAVARVLAHPPDADAWLQYTDAPGVYRKLRLMSFVGKTVPAGFDGTYRMACTFFSAKPDEWKAKAQERAAELKSVTQ
jgi:hypothetical protein